jgi:dimethylaniline monooxygenase (N-oxide forming)
MATLRISAAFVGQLALVGPYFPVLELQARLAVMVFSGVRSLPDAATRQAGVDRFRMMDQLGAPLLYHDAVVDLATAADVVPDVADYPELAGELVFGPIVPSQFRLTGHGASPDREARLREELSGLG